MPLLGIIISQNPEHFNNSFRTFDKLASFGYNILSGGGNLQSGDGSLIDFPIDPK